MRRFLLAAILGALIVGQAGGEEIIVAHPRAMDWGERIVFYVDAQPELASAMQAAMRKAAEENPELCDDGAATAWICSDLRFRAFTGVGGDGRELLSGFACSVDEDIPELKYYHEDLIGYSPCVIVDWDEEIRTYFVEEAEE